MSEEAGTANLNEGNLETGSPGGSGEGQGGSGSDSFQSQLATLEERRRHFQGLADQRQSRIAELEGQLASVEELQAQLDSLQDQLASAGRGPSVDEIAAKVAETLAAQQAANEWKLQVAQKYPGVDMKVIKGASLEEIESAAKAKFDEQKALSDTLRAQLEAEYKEKYGKAFGGLGDDANADVMDQGDRGGAEGGVMTVEKFMTMSDEQAANLPDDVWQKMMTELNAKESAA